MCSTTYATMKDKKRRQQKNHTTDWQFSSAKYKHTILSRVAKTDSPTLDYRCLLMLKKPWSKYASLDCKGAEARHRLPALIPVLQAAFAETMEDCEGHMLRASTSFEKLVKLWHEMSWFPTASEYEQTLYLAGAFLRSYEWLSIYGLWERTGRAST